MTNSTTRPVPAGAPRAAFAAASFASLRSAAGEGQGEALRIALADIDEDPNQPRTVFDDEALESMAESIRAYGVVQPVVVRPPVNGRYVLVFGARRVRASRLAGVADIAAVVRAAGGKDFAAQVIENQQRAALSNSDLAAAISRLRASGSTNREIAAICSLKDYQVAAFRQAENFPPALAARIDTADIRALYDLYRQWCKTPARVLAALPDSGTFLNVTEARRIIGAITGMPTGSIVLDRNQTAALVISEPVAVAEPVHRTDVPVPVCAPALIEPAVLPRSAKTAADQVSHRMPETTRERDRAVPVSTQADVVTSDRLPIFIVSLGDGQTGRLVVDRKSDREGWALVEYATGVEEIEACALRFVRID